MGKMSEWRDVLMALTAAVLLIFGVVFGLSGDYARGCFNLVLALLVRPTLEVPNAK